MTALTDHPSSNVVKLLNIGESGTGKTGALASLAKAGYRLWILDYDNGLDILGHALRDDPGAASRVTYETLRDRHTFTNGVPKIKPPVAAFAAAGKTLETWGAANFGAEDVIVIDTLTTFSEAAFNHSLFLAGRLNQRSQLTDYGDMAKAVISFIDTITDKEFPCNVVINTHIKHFSGDEESQISARGLPNAKGQQISKDISLFFNTVVLSRSIGSGQATKRVIATYPAGVVEVKTSNPFKVKPTYPIETGMADLFKDILGHSPTPRTGATPTALPPTKDE